MRRAFIFCFLVWAILIIWAWRAWAGPYLACDLPEPGVTISQTKVEITKVSDGSVSVVSGLVQPEAAAFKLLDLSGLAAGAYKFRAWWADVTGFWSEPSLFLIAGKPAPAGGLRVVP